MPIFLLISFSPLSLLLYCLLSSAFPPFLLSPSSLLLFLFSVILTFFHLNSSFTDSSFAPSPPHPFFLSRDFHYLFYFVSVILPFFLPIAPPLFLHMFPCSPAPSRRLSLHSCFCLSSVFFTLPPLLIFLQSFLTHFPPCPLPHLSPIHSSSISLFFLPSSLPPPPLFMWLLWKQGCKVNLKQEADDNIIM